MVFKTDEKGVMNEYSEKTIRQIIAAGFRVRVYFSCGRDEIFCEMRAPVERIVQFADQVLDQKATLHLRQTNVVPFRLTLWPRTFFVYVACAHLFFSHIALGRCEWG